MSIDRRYMPQIDDIDAFLKYLTDNGVKYSHTTIHPVRVVPSHQKPDEFRISKFDMNDYKTPIITAANRMVIDGHHRWRAHLYLYAVHGIADYVPTVHLELPFEEAILVADAFPLVRHKGLKT